MKLKTINKQWIVTHGDKTITFDNSTSAWQYIFKHLTTKRGESNVLDR